MEGRQLLRRNSGEDEMFSDDESGHEDHKKPLGRTLELSRGDRIALASGLGLMAMIFGIDTATTWSYSSYALSYFKRLSQQGLLEVLDNIISAAVKLPIAKTSDVLGRAETYCILMLLYAAGHAVRATAPSFGAFLMGVIFYSAGQAGTAILNIILISDFTSVRTRGVALNAFWLLNVFVAPLASGGIVDSVVDGIGWRWGYGMFALIMPLGGLFLAATLFHLQRKQRAAEKLPKTRISVGEFCSQIDLGGLILLCSGFAVFILPMLLASQSQDGLHSFWTVLIMAIGAAILIGAWRYEKHVAKYPALPAKYFRSLSLVTSLLLACLDAIGFRSTHTYLFPWSIVSQNLSPGHALYLSYANGIAQCAVGVVTGAIMYRKRSYKWITVVGSIIRLVGYGVMIRLRTNESTIFELFLVQIIQGIGSGIIETTALLAVQITTSPDEIAQVTGLHAMSIRLGAGIGSAIAGTIYTRNLKSRLRFHLGKGVGEGRIDDLFDSITGTLPAWGSAQRNAVAAAYSDVLGYISVVALAVSVPLVLVAFIMPNAKLKDSKGAKHSTNQQQDIEL